MKKTNEKDLRVNWEIKTDNVRLVGDNVSNDIIPVKQAIAIAKSMNLDLIEINPNATPPICKIADYNKYLYDQKKRQKEQEKKNRQNLVELKEMRFTPTTGEHDYEFKKKHVNEFIKNGDKVKAVVIFSGREMKYQEQGEIILLKLADELSDIAIVEKLPSLEGKRMTMIIKPKK